jgi:SAM-dependent methyltransferase
MPTLAGFFPGTEMPREAWWEALWPDPAEVLAAVGVTPGSDVIDLCCGDGWFTLPMARVARRVFAIDIDPVMLQAARVHLAGVTNCKFIEGDAHDVAKLVRPPVDLVFMANAFHGVREPTRLACAVAKALKPHGRFVIVNWHQRPREQTTVLGEPRGPATNLRIGPIATSEAVEPAGFKLREVIELPPYHYGAIFERLRPPAP